ncbi:Periplasmic protein TorT [wastewater metagenome]|uniref:Periplasmic protein TorT n=2 Tax=unclassified sequences TaxID=12908 RepID=A0A5B8R680_9ZZZZ|nr:MULTISPECIES: TMAO reductase system periplasmic protein TorT [Arhodomonas]MCS4504932.1 TMAO reductase system periplasmic protein TorT [Arhodomonas aquaeolei]QEA04116.1 periplasmic protein TorT [uncultured organism]
MNARQIMRAGSAAVFGGLLLAASTAQAFDVEAYYGNYDVSGKKAGRPATSLGEARSEEWKAPTPDKPYRIGVSFPHLKDPYWLAVNYGIIDEARKLGVGIDLVAAQGYEDITGQISQVENLRNRGVDGLILAAISYTAQDGLVKSLSADIPVIEVINDIQAPAIAAKTLVSFYTMGYVAGEYVAKDSEGKDRVSVAFLPGPAGSGWAPDTLDGFKQALADHDAEERVDIITVKWGDTGKSVQTSIIENVMNANPDLDYLAGNAVAADAAPDVLRDRDNKPKIVSTFLIPPLYEKIKNGEVAVAPTDFTALQGRMAVDAMVRILNGEKPGEDFPFRAGPKIQPLTPETIDQYDYEDMLGARDWRPVFSVEPKE